MTIEILFYTQLGSIIAFIGALFVLYRLLVSQKDATIQLLKEKNEFLSQKLNDASQNSPYALAKSLHEQVTILDKEIERLSKDKENNQERILNKENELNDVKNDAEELSRQIAKAHELMEEFFCPNCGSPMAERAYQSESVEYQGREIDIDHEYVTYECGYILIDGKASSSCEANESCQ
jgi:rubrerythrin